MTDLAALADQITEEDDIEGIDSRQQSEERERSPQHLLQREDCATVWQKEEEARTETTEGTTIPRETRSPRSASGLVPTTRVEGQQRTRRGRLSGGLFSIVNPANFSANYGYNEQYRRDIYTDNFRNVEHRGRLNYGSSPSPRSASLSAKSGSCGTRNTSG